MEGENDSHILQNLLQTSKSNFQEKLIDKIKNTVISKYRFNYQDYQEVANHILHLAHNRP